MTKWPLASTPLMRLHRARWAVCGVWCGGRRVEKKGAGAEHAGGYRYRGPWLKEVSCALLFAMAASAPRDVDGRMCSLRSCGAVLTPSDDGVRVATPVKRLGRVSASTRKGLAVAWSPSAPTAFFHARCWGAVLRGARLLSAPFVRGGPQAERAAALARAGGGGAAKATALAMTAAASAAPALHAVSPLTSCPHLRNHVRVLPAGPSPSGAACSGCCGVHGEVWSCLSCGHAGCGRHGCGHATAHAASSEHPVARAWGRGGAGRGYSVRTE